MCLSIVIEILVNCLGFSFTVLAQPKPRRQELKNIRTDAAGLEVEGEGESPLKTIELSTFWKGDQPAKSWAPIENSAAYCVVSHRWMDTQQPDAGGQQMRAIKEYLEKHQHIEYVWFE